MSNAANIILSLLINKINHCFVQFVFIASISCDCPVKILLWLSNMIVQCQWKIITEKANMLLKHYEHTERWRGLRKGRLNFTGLRKLILCIGNFITFGVLSDMVESNRATEIKIAVIASYNSISSTNFVQYNNQ